MSLEPTGALTVEEARQIAVGVALFVGSMALAALLEPRMPWSQHRRAAQPVPSGAEPTHEENIHDPNS